MATLDTIAVSGGAKGVQLVMAAGAYLEVVGGMVAPIAR